MEALWVPEKVREWRPSGWLEDFRREVKWEEPDCGLGEECEGRVGEELRRFFEVNWGRKKESNEVLKRKEAEEKMMNEIEAEDRREFNLLSQNLAELAVKSKDRDGMGDAERDELDKVLGEMTARLEEIKALKPWATGGSCKVKRKNLEEVARKKKELQGEREMHVKLLETVWKAEEELRQHEEAGRVGQWNHANWNAWLGLVQKVKEGRKAVGDWQREHPHVLAPDPTAESDGLGSTTEFAYCCHGNPVNSLEKIPCRPCFIAAGHDPYTNEETSPGKPILPHPSAPPAAPAEIPAYSLHRYIAALSRILALLTHNLDPHLHSPTMWYTFYLLSLHLKLHTLPPIIDTIVNWFYHPRNRGFIESHTLLCLKMADALQAPILLKECWALCVSRDVTRIKSGEAFFKIPTERDEKENLGPYWDGVQKARWALAGEVKGAWDRLIKMEWVDELEDLKVLKEICDAPEGTHGTELVFAADAVRKIAKERIMMAILDQIGADEDSIFNHKTWKQLSVLKIPWSWKIKKEVNTRLGKFNCHPNMDWFVRVKNRGWVTIEASIIQGARWRYQQSHDHDMSEMISFAEALLSEDPRDPTKPDPEVLRPSQPLHRRILTSLRGTNPSYVASSTSNSLSPFNSPSSINPPPIHIDPLLSHPLSITDLNIPSHITIPQENPTLCVRVSMAPLSSIGVHTDTTTYPSQWHTHLLPDQCAEIMDYLHQKPGTPLKSVPPRVQVGWFLPEKLEAVKPEKVFAAAAKEVNRVAEKFTKNEGEFDWGNEELLTFFGEEVWKELPAWVTGEVGEVGVGERCGEELGDEAMDGESLKVEDRTESNTGDSGWSWNWGGSRVGSEVGVWSEGSEGGGKREWEKASSEVDTVKSGMDGESEAGTEIGTEVGSNSEFGMEGAEYVEWEEVMAGRSGTENGEAESESAEKDLDLDETDDGWVDDDFV